MQAQQLHHQAIKFRTDKCVSDLGNINAESNYQISEIICPTSISPQKCHVADHGYNWWYLWIDVTRPQMVKGPWKSYVTSVWLAWICFKRNKKITTPPKKLKTLGKFGNRLRLWLDFILKWVWTPEN